MTRMGKNFSNYDSIELGVPQGSIFGPLLFIIFINDLILTTKFSSILFADDTSQYDSDMDLVKLIRKFLKKFDHTLEWINYNHMYLNWSKTKFMIISNSVNLIPPSISINGNDVEIVKEFKLLGVTIDDKLTFESHVKNIIKSVNIKLISLKSMFYLNHMVRAQFFKTFIQPNFDYCFSLYIYMNATQVEKLVKSFNTCIYRLFSIDLQNNELVDQLKLLEPYKILPLAYRYFYRLSVFAFKIVNNQILKSFHNKLIKSESHYNTRNNGNFQIPFCKTAKGDKRLSIVLPKILNNVLKNSLNHKESDFRMSLITNLVVYFRLFEDKVLKVLD